MLLFRTASFNAARSILCGATSSYRNSSREFGVSMPHAAFYVVQLVYSGTSARSTGFNAARSILCGATQLCVPDGHLRCCFNAARSILCGATPSLAALVPRGARGRFGKSSIFFAVSPLWGGIFTEKSRRQSASSLVRRGVAPKWKIATVECGFAASPSHFPLFCTMSVS